MPIAHCFIPQNLTPGDDDIVQLWAKESGQSSAHMTINVIHRSQQLGHPYPVMVTLLLPSLWSSDAISSLQRGLAKALSQHYGLSIDDIHIVTQIVASGMVVESGQEQHW
ncbi:hypothetical protein MIB92_11300 [Aestuariirhabdus sp. Z084]|uniref:hypothetical protein n=1 Tax=Aestuariirhabdus haliotis TaxID=2918751 RepID=UPI00201B3A76|nr:hypothetical protein [Aestuariirhabdus haliotis]MCL6416239.1 hypothetical protein [Aestuariirhabdus haliotis]MCL6420301.1 hypothetical protein [Aestuariirhabdus haliotis]